jgi:hypothetical protein
MPVEPVGATPRTTRSVPNKTVSSNLNALVKTRTSPQKQFQNPPGPTKLLPQTNPPTPSLHHHELLRSVTLKFQTNRASVRRWALQNNLAPDTRYKQAPKPVKRWQVRDLGALWQYDASPHAWLPGSSDKQVLLDLLDDATCLNTGARLYPRETLLAHFDFLPGVFQIHGLPLALYVDYHSFFYTHNPDAFTQLGAALHFYGVALRYAPTPQAKESVSYCTRSVRSKTRLEPAPFAGAV